MCSLWFLDPGFIVNLLKGKEKPKETYFIVHWAIKHHPAIVTMVSSSAVCQKFPRVRISFQQILSQNYHTKIIYAWVMTMVETYRCVKSRSPLKAYLDAVSILLLSMNLWDIATPHTGWSDGFGGIVNRNTTELTLTLHYLFIYLLHQ